MRFNNNKKYPEKVKLNKNSVSGKKGNTFNHSEFSFIVGVFASNFAYMKNKDVGFVQ